jgi:hypothetical protein
MSKTIIVSNHHSFNRSDWFSNSIDPVRSGYYEILFKNSSIIGTAKWKFGKWNMYSTMPFKWRGITERQYHRLSTVDQMSIDYESIPPVPCFSCDKEHYENDDDLLLMSGEYICPDCGMGWIMLEDREDIPEE